MTIMAYYRLFYYQSILFICGYSCRPCSENFSSRESQIANIEFVVLKTVLPTVEGNYDD